MRLTINKNKCVGCRICELACSFHLKEEFNQEYSNIRIYFNDDGGLDIKILESCSCNGKPLCVEFCPTDTIIENEEI